MKCRLGSLEKSDACDANSVNFELVAAASFRRRKRAAPLFLLRKFIWDHDEVYSWPRVFLLFTDYSLDTSTEMPLLAVRSAPFLLSDYCSSIRSVSVSSSLSEMASTSFDFSSSDTLNLEDIKAQLSQCCLTCGVCWKDEHFSFDCSECGGYSMIRPCMGCGGTCGALWTRDFALVNIFYIRTFRK